MFSASIKRGGARSKLRGQAARSCIRMQEFHSKGQIMKRKDYSKKIAEKCEKFLSFCRDRRRPSRAVKGSFEPNFGNLRSAGKESECRRREEEDSRKKRNLLLPARSGKKEISVVPPDIRVRAQAVRSAKEASEKNALPADAAVFRVGREHPCSVGLPCPEPPQKERTDYTRPREIDPDQFSDLAQKAVFTVFRKTSPLSAANLSWREAFSFPKRTDQDGIPFPLFSGRRGGNVSLSAAKRAIITVESYYTETEPRLR